MVAKCRMKPSGTAVAEGAEFLLAGQNGQVESQPPAGLPEAFETHSQGCSIDPRG